jgi:hypothetical protein
MALLIGWHAGPADDGLDEMGEARREADRAAEVQDEDAWPVHGGRDGVHDLGRQRRISGAVAGEIHRVENTVRGEVQDGRPVCVHGGRQLRDLDHRALDQGEARLDMAADGGEFAGEVVPARSGVAGAGEHGA